MLFFMGYNNEGYINNRIGFVEKLYPYYIFFKIFIMQNQILHFKWNIIENWNVNKV